MSARRTRPRGERVFPRFSIREDVERELDSHVALRAEELIAAGWDPESAEREARRLLGDRAKTTSECVEVVKRHHRAERRAKTVEGIVQDLRYGVRTIARSPGFALVSIVTLALGIGANTAIFSVVEGVLIEPLPYEEPDELVAVWEDRRQGGRMQVAWANFIDWKEQLSSFEGLFAYGAGATTVLGGETPVTTRVAVVTLDVWSTLGARPVEGRLTTSTDHVLGAAPVLVVSRSFWQNELAGRQLDQLRLEVNGHSARVVGVVADDFDFPVGTDVWQPLELLGQSQSRTAHNWRVVGRVADGVAVQRADEEVDQLTQRLVAGDGGEDPDFLAVGASVLPLHGQMVGDARSPLVMLLGAAGLVLLVACANLASTLLARGTTRARELAVRASLGAAKGRIVRQLLTESVAIALAGAAAGLALGAGIIGVLKRTGPASIPRLDQVGIDATVLVYTAGLALATVFLFGLLPALRLTDATSGNALRRGYRGNAVGRRTSVWNLLVGSEVALALVLLVGASLLVRSFEALISEDAGIDAADVLTMPIALSNVRYESPDDHAVWYTETLRELDRLTGVAAAGVISSLPASGFLSSGRLEIDGNLDARAEAAYVVASAGAFEALDVPLLQGRLFEPSDLGDRPHVAIVSQSFAERYWPGESALGHLVTGGGMDNFYMDRTFAEVVGVVGDVRYRQLGEPPEPTVYFPYSQRPFRIRFGSTLLLEASNGDPASVAAAFRSTVQRMDQDVPIELEPLRTVIGDSLAEREFTMLLLAAFSLVALVLAVVGIYGVVSYSVASRIREMGIRLALGADPGVVLRLVMASALRMVTGGVILGIVGALLMGPLMRGLLYGVGPSDPLAIGVSAAILLAAAALASWLPARVGTRVDPIVTMRAE